MSFVPLEDYQHVLVQRYQYEHWFCLCSSQQLEQYSIETNACLAEESLYHLF